MKADDLEWLQQYVTQPISQLRAGIQYAKAAERVESSVVVGGGVVLELNEEMEPHAKATVLREQIHKLIGTVSMLNEQAVRLGEDAIHHEVEELLKGEAHATKLGSLAQIQGVLLLMDGWLTLTDKELSHHLNEIHGVIPGVATYSDLVKGITEVLGGAVVSISSFAAATAKIGGQPVMAAQALGLARGAALKLAQVVAVVEIVWGIATLLDPSTSAEKKEEALVDVGLGGGWLIAGGPGSLAALGGYIYLKWAANLYWLTTLSLIGGWMSMAFANIQEQGQRIAQGFEELYRSSELLAREKDPEQLVALKKVQQNSARHLGQAVDDFISDCEPVGYGVGVAKYPGAYAALREVFSPIMRLRGSDQPEEVTRVAPQILERIAWSLQNANDIVMAAASKETVAEWGAKHKHGQGEDGTRASH